jgi:hypothetical protein
MLPHSTLPMLAQVVFEHALLRCHLRARVQMLLTAAAARAEMRAARRDAHGRRLDDLRDLRDFVARLFAVRRVSDELARQRALDEDDLAVGMRDAAAFLVQRLDADHCALRFPAATGYAGQSSRNSSQCGSVDLPSVARTKSISCWYLSGANAPRIN